MAKVKTNNEAFLRAKGNLAPLDAIDPIKEKGNAYLTSRRVSTESPIDQNTLSEDYSRGYNVGTSLKNKIAENQNGWDQFGNFLAQTGIEAVAGTLEGASYIADLQQHLNTIQGEEKEFTNWFADGVKKIKEEQNANFPVYLSDENEEFNPSSAEWWAHHGGQGLGSTLSLLIPGMAAAKVGKLAGLGKLGQTLSATVASRIAESTMEANQVYGDAVLKGASPEAAAEAATKTYNTNWLFAIQDFAQFGAITKGFGSAAKGQKGFGFGELIKQMASEGAEEAGQYVVSEEAKNQLSIQA